MIINIGVTKIALQSFYIYGSWVRVRELGILSRRIRILLLTQDP